MPLTSRAKSGDYAKSQFYMPDVLTNSKSRLVKAALAVNHARDTADPNDPDSKALWRPLHNLWEREVKRYCPSYRPLKGEFFGTICDSGREGEYAAGPDCVKCQFLCCDFAVAPTPLLPAAPLPPSPLPAVNMLPIRQHADSFAELAAYPPKRITDPEVRPTPGLPAPLAAAAVDWGIEFDPSAKLATPPAVTSAVLDQVISVVAASAILPAAVPVPSPDVDATPDPEPDLTAEFNSLVEDIPSYRAAIRQTSDEATVLYYEGCIKETLRDATALAAKFPPEQIPGLLQHLALLRV